LDPKTQSTMMMSADGSSNTPRPGDDDEPVAVPEPPPPSLDAQDTATMSDNSEDGRSAAPQSAKGEASHDVPVEDASTRTTHDRSSASSSSSREGEAGAAVEAKNPFDSDEGDGADPDAAATSGGIADPGVTREAASASASAPSAASAAAAATPLPASAPSSPSPPRRRGSTQPQTSPFPKFEPYRPNAPSMDERNDDNDNDDEDEWGAFDDGFHDEDRREAFGNDALAAADRNGVNLGMPGLGVNGDASSASSSPPARGGGSKSAATRSALFSSATSTSILTLEDIEICQRLDEEFDRALEEREIGWAARYSSVRQSACLSLTFMAIYLVLGTWYFFRHTDWALNDTLLFTIYTITTVGYGNHEIPDTPGVQLFIIFFVFIGIATLTIMVAQVYQCVALETTRAQYSRDKAELSRKRQNRSSHLATSTSSGINGIAGRVSSVHGSGEEPWAVDFDSVSVKSESCGDRFWRHLDQSKHFLSHTQLGRGVSVLLPFVGLISIGAAVVGPIEGWTFVESIYFAVVSLTTVGFGDYFPTKNASTWFCIFWLPFSIGFMSLYLGGIAHFYIQLSNSNIQRLERQMRRRMRKAKEWAEKERQQASARVEAANAAKKRKEQAALEVESGGEDDTVEGAMKVASTPSHKGKRTDFFQTLPSGELFDEDEGGIGASGVGAVGKQNLTTSRSHHFGSPDSSDGIGAKRREQIIANATQCEEFQDSGAAGGTINGDVEGGAVRPQGRTMTTMRDVISTVHGHIHNTETGSAQGHTSETLASIITGDVSVSVAPETEMMSIRSSAHAAFSGKKPSERKPSFALRVLVQERLAEIIAIEIAGYQTQVDIKDNTMSVTIDRLTAALDKWFIPRRARKSFRAVAFEALYFVGERGLITRGADSLYDLTPFEFHSLFAPVLAAMGDADTMEGWLDTTNVLAEVDLKKDGIRSSSNVATKLLPSERLAVVHERQQSNVSSTVTANASKYRRHITVPGNAFSSKSAARR